MRSRDSNAPMHLWVAQTSASSTSPHSSTHCDHSEVELQGSRLPGLGTHSRFRFQPQALERILH